MMINGVMSDKSAENTSLFICLSFAKWHETIKTGNGGGSLPVPCTSPSAWSSDSRELTAWRLS